VLLWTAMKEGVLSDTLRVSTSPGPGHFAITGGTRAYRGATGEVTFVDNPDPARDNVTFRFSTPR
jgi:hypothetical protein